MSLPGAASGKMVRQVERIPLDLPVAFVGAGGAPRAGRLVNLSGTGAFLATSDPAPAGTRVEVTAALPLSSGDEPLQVRAEVKWVNGQSRTPCLGMPPGMGLEFVDLDAAAYYLLGVFIGEHWVSRRGSAVRRGPQEDLRDTRRYVLLDFPARLQRADGTLVAARLINLSANGVYLALDTPEPMGRDVPLILTLPYRGRRKRVHASAVVRWINDAGAPTSPDLPPGMGLEFTQRSARTRQVLEEVLDELLTQIMGNHGL
jgi:Tfp pilus assembly protein PilZ